jgi:uncharacterized protein (DUF697 family)
MGSIFKNKVREKVASVIDLEILMVLVTRLLRQNLNRLIKSIKPVEL